MFRLIGFQLYLSPALFPARWSKQEVSSLLGNRCEASALVLLELEMEAKVHRPRGCVRPRYQRGRGHGEGGGLRDREKLLERWRDAVTVVCMCV